MATMLKRTAICDQCGKEVFVNGANPAPACPDGWCTPDDRNPLPLGWSWIRHEYYGDGGWEKGTWELCPECAATHNGMVASGLLLREAFTVEFDPNSDGWVARSRGGLKEYGSRPEVAAQKLIHAIWP